MEHEHRGRETSRWVATLPIYDTAGGAAVESCDIICANERLAPSLSTHSIRHELPSEEDTKTAVTGPNHDPSFRWAKL